MSKYIGSNAVNLSTTSADVTGNADIDGNLTVGGNLTVTGTTITLDHANAQTVDLGDNDKIRLGDGDDLQLYHDGGNSYIKDTGTGDLRIWADNPNIATASGNKIFFGNNGAAELYYTGGSKKLAASATGIDVTGTVTTDKLNVTHAGGGDFVGLFQNTTSATPYGVHIKDAASGANGYPLLQVTNSAGSSPYLLVHSGTGNVGIGTSTPNGYSGYTVLTLDNATNGGIIDIERGGNLIGEIFSFDSSTFALSAVGSRAINFSTNSSERMRITSAGDVGIGTSSPTSSYGTNLNVHASGTNGAALHLTDGTTGTTDNDGFHLLTYGGSAYVWNRESTAMLFGTSNVEKMRIKNDGTVFIAKTDVGNATGIQFDQSGRGYFVRNSGAVLLLNRLGSDGTVVQFYNDSNGVGTISVSGSSTAYNTSSDYRLKTDVQPMVGASDRVQALNPVNFEWIASGDRVDGFLAHEAAAVIPEAITGDKDAMKDEEYEVTPAVEATFDEEGNVLTEAVDAVMGTRSVPDYQGIDQSKIVPLLTAALQEALTKIDSLETRLTALEGA